MRDGVRRRGVIMQRAWRVDIGGAIEKHQQCAYPPALYMKPQPYHEQEHRKRAHANIGCGESCHWVLRAYQGCDEGRRYAVYKGGARRRPLSRGKTPCHGAVIGAVPAFPIVVSDRPLSY